MTKPRFIFSMSNKDLIGNNVNLGESFRTVIIHDTTLENDDKQIVLELELRDDQLIVCQVDSNDLEIKIEY